MNTLYALESRGLIKRRVAGAVSWTGWERTTLEWIKIRELKGKMIQDIAKVEMAKVEGEL